MNIGRRTVPKNLATEVVVVCSSWASFLASSSLSNTLTWRSASSGGVGPTGNRLSPSTWVWAFLDDDAL